MKKVGVSDYKDFSQNLLKLITDKPISLEVFTDEIDLMEEQAREISSWGKNVYVKIPITNSKGKSTIDLIKRLINDNIKCNITAVLTFNQVKEILKVANDKTEMIISIFAGRIADTGINPINIMKDSVGMCKEKKNIKILWASTREVLNIFEANRINCHIITVPHEILKKFKNIGKDLTEVSLETVKSFYSDAKEAGFQIKINKS